MGVDVILIMILIGLILYGIDMLVCKINAKAGFMVAIFNIPFLPVGLVTFILTQKHLEKKLGVTNVTEYFVQEKEKKKAKKVNKRKQAVVNVNINMRSDGRISYTRG